MSFATGALLLAVLLVSGCSLITATVVGTTAVATTAVQSTAKVTTATVVTTGKVTAAALTSSGDVAALSIETAAKLARTGMVVLVDAGTGVAMELPWREGLELHAAMEARNLRAAFKVARLFREGRVTTQRLGSHRTGARRAPLQAGDVVELLR